MIITPQASGDSIKVSFSNQFGTAQLRLADLHVGVAGDGSSVVAGTDRRLMFDGSTDATIPPGAAVLSDPTTLSVAAFVPLAITYYVPDTSTLDVHLAAMHTEFTTPGEAVITRAMSAVPHIRKGLAVRSPSAASRYRYRLRTRRWLRSGTP